MPTPEFTLVLAKTVHHAAHRCLHSLLQRFIMLRPCRPNNAKFNIKTLQFWKYSPNTPSRLLPRLECQRLRLISKQKQVR